MGRKYSQKEMENAVMIAGSLWQRFYNAKSTEGYGTLEVVMTIIQEACNMERWITENYGQDDDCYLDRVEEYEKILEEKYDLPKATPN